MLAMIVNGETKSNAKLFRIFRMTKILVGDRFSLNLEITNIDEEFAGGLFEIWEEWPNGQLVHYQQALGHMGKDETTRIERPNWEALTPGYALFYVRITAFIGERKEEVNIFKSKNAPLPRLPDGRLSSFLSLLAVTKEEIYQYYALIVAIVSLVIIVSEKALWMWQFGASMVQQMLNSSTTMFPLLEHLVRTDLEIFVFSFIWKIF